MLRLRRKQKLLKISEAAEMLNVHPNTLRKWDREGVLKAVRFGVRGDRRYRKEDLEKYLKNAGFQHGKHNRK